MVGIQQSCLWRKCVGILPVGSPFIFYSGVQLQVKQCGCTRGTSLAMWTEFCGNKGKFAAGMTIEMDVLGCSPVEIDCF